MHGSLTVNGTTRLASKCMKQTDGNMHLNVCNKQTEICTALSSACSDSDW